MTAEPDDRRAHINGVFERCLDLPLAALAELQSLLQHHGQFTDTNALLAHSATGTDRWDKSV